jgi:uncharacterized protein
VKAVFADTFYWVALTNRADPYNRRVVARAQEIGQTTIVTTDSVRTEFLTFFVQNPHWRNRAGQTVRALLDASDVRVIAESRGIFLSGLELYNARPDKGYSMTDCISMQTMRREGLTEVLTNDRHFEQEGFQRDVSGSLTSNPRETRTSPKTGAIEFDTDVIPACVPRRKAC